MKVKKSVKKANKKLIKEFPFLMPRDVWTSKIFEDYDYSYTKFDYIPEGWRKAFGIQFMKELKVALGDYIDEYRVIQIKEKYGSLRWYDFGAPKEVYKVIEKYQNLSKVTCIVCGKPATKIAMGWISPYCDKCFPGGKFYKINEDKKIL